MDETSLLSSRVGRARVLVLAGLYVDRVKRLQQREAALASFLLEMGCLIAMSFLPRFQDRRWTRVKGRECERSWLGKRNLCGSYNQGKEDICGCKVR